MCASYHPVHFIAKFVSKEVPFYGVTSIFPYKGGLLIGNLNILFPMWVAFLTLNVTANS